MSWFTNKSVLLTVVAIAVALMYASTAGATLIYPANYSFEDPVVGGDPNGYRIGVPSNWAISGADQRITDKDAPAAAGITNTTGEQYDILGRYNAVTQVLSGPTIQALTTYQLSADITTEPGSRDAGYGATGANWELALYAVSGTVYTKFASLTIAGADIDATNGVFTTWSTAAVQPASSLIGQQLAVQAAGEFQGANDRSFAIDNVRINSTVVPEPGTLTLLGAGALALLLAAWRRKNPR